MWEAFRQAVEAQGIPVRLGHPCVELRHSHGRVRSVVVGSNGTLREHPVKGVLSSMALSDLVLSLSPRAPEHVVAAARRLRYRSMCLVALITTEAEPFPDNWIYLHDPCTRAGRVHTAHTLHAAIHFGPSDGGFPR